MGEILAIVHDSVRQSQELHILHKSWKLEGLSYLYVKLRKNGIFHRYSHLLLQYMPHTWRDEEETENGSLEVTDIDGPLLEEVT